MDSKREINDFLGDFVSPKPFWLMGIVLFPIIAVVFTGLILIFIATIWEGLSRFWLSLIFYSQGVVILGLIFSSSEVAYVWKRAPGFLPQGIMLAVVLRVFTTIVGVLVCTFIFGTKCIEFFIFTMVFYMVGLIVETIMVVKLVRMGQNGCKS